MHLSFEFCKFQLHLPGSCSFISEISLLHLFCGEYVSLCLILLFDVSDYGRKARSEVKILLPEVMRPSSSYCRIRSLDRSTRVANPLLDIRFSLLILIIDICKPNQTLDI